MAIRLDCDMCGCTVFNKVKDGEDGVFFACDDCGEEVYVQTERVKPRQPNG